MSKKQERCVWCGFEKKVHTEKGWIKHNTERKINYDSPLIKEHPPIECVDCGIYHTSYTLQTSSITVQQSCYPFYFDMEIDEMILYLIAGGLGFGLCVFVYTIGNLITQKEEKKC